MPKRYRYDFCEDVSYTVVNHTVSSPAWRIGGEIDVTRLSAIDGMKKKPAFPGCFKTMQCESGRKSTLCLFREGVVNQTGAKSVLADAIVPYERLALSILLASAALGRPVALRPTMRCISNTVTVSCVPSRINGGRGVVPSVLAQHFPGNVAIYLPMQFPGVRINIGGDRTSGCIPREINDEEPKMYAVVYVDRVVVTGVSTAERSWRAHAHVHHWLHRIFVEGYRSNTATFG